MDAVRGMAYYFDEPPRVVAWNYFVPRCWVREEPKAKKGLGFLSGVLDQSWVSLFCASIEVEKINIPVFRRQWCFARSRPRVIRCRNA